MIRVFIADDHAMVRDGLKRVLRDEQDIVVVGEARNASELLGALGGEAIDVVLLDISMPGRSGLDILGEIASAHRHVKVLVLSMHPEDRFATRAIKSGAAGYITKESATNELVAAIRKVYSGGKHISPHLAEKLATELQLRTPALPHEQLSEREFQVLRMIGEGKTVSRIADDLSLSVSTINTYRGRIMEKIQARNTADLIRYTLENKLIE